MGGAIKTIVLDVLKPHKPGVEIYAEELSGLEGIEAADITTLEMDAKTETLKITLDGSDVKLNLIEDKITELGGTVHSVDKVIANKNK